MMRLVELRLLLVAGLLTFAVACGDDDGGSGDDGDDVADDGDDGGDDGGDDDGDDGDDGGDDGGVTLAELSEEDARALCEEALDGFGEAITELICYATGIGSSGGDVEACEMTVADCIAETEPMDEACAVDPDDEMELPDCADEITVAEMRTCIEATRDQFLALVEGISCESDVEDLPDAENIELPEECMALQAQCPELFEEPK
jgi:hypothetical protein